MDSDGRGVSASATEIVGKLGNFDLELGLGGQLLLPVFQFCKSHPLLDGLLVLSLDFFLIRFVGTFVGLA